MSDQDTKCIAWNQTVCGIWMTMSCLTKDLCICHKVIEQYMPYCINEEQIITCYPIDGAMGSSGVGRVRELSVVCLHSNAIVARGILVTILHCGTSEPCLMRHLYC